MTDHDHDDADFDPDRSATDDELRAATALARALDRGSFDAVHGSDTLEDGDLRFAALLQYSADEGAIDPARLDAILADVFDEARVRPVAAPVPWWKKILAPTTGFALAATMVAVLFTGPPEGMALPSPNAGLLEAQMSAASGDTAGALQDQMRPYRSELLSALEDQYR